MSTRLGTLIRSIRPRSHREADLQVQIELRLKEHEIEFEREVALSDADRIDFLVAGGMGVEVKVAGSLSDLTRQLHRYALSYRVTRLMVVSTLLRHGALPASLNHKPIEFVHLIGAAL